MVIAFMKLCAAIKTRQFDIVEYYFQRYIDDPNERDMLIGMAIETEQPEIVALVLRTVSTVEHWDYMESARILGNQKIIEMIEKWAQRYL